MKLFYDSNCPVCSSFVKLLRKQVTLSELSFEEISPEKLEEYQDFYIEDQGNIFIGKEAVDYLAEKHPEIQNFFWILPPEYRKGALQKSYKFASWIRRWILGKRDCNCN